MEEGRKGKQKEEKGRKGGERGGGEEVKVAEGKRGERGTYERKEAVEE